MKKLYIFIAILLIAMLSTVTVTAFDDELIYFPSKAYQDGYIPALDDVRLFSETEDPEIKDPDDTSSDESEAPEPLPETIDPETLAAVKADIVAAWTNMDGYISFDQYDFSYELFLSDVVGIYSDILNENPGMFYVDGALYHGSSTKYIRPIYNYTPEELPEVKEAFESAVADAVSLVDTATMNQTDIAIVLHDHIVINAEYDLETLNNKNGENHEAFSAYGVLVNGLGVCQSYTLAYNYLLSLFGIETSFISAVLPDGVGHIWSLVKFDDDYYQTDVTWNDPVPDKKGIVSYQYFLLNDAEFAADGKHGTEWVNPYPNDSEYFSNAFWKIAQTGMIFMDGRFYFSSRDSEYKLNSADTDTLSEYTELRTVSGTGWKISGVDRTLNGGLFRVTPFLLDGELYYNNATTIYKYTPDAKEDGTVYKHTNVFGFILPQPHKSDTTVTFKVVEYVDPTNAQLFTYSDDITVFLTTLLGDINCNGIVDPTDSVYISRHLANWWGYTTLPIDENCDINGDGLINANDAVILSRYVASWSGYTDLPFTDLI